MTLTFTVGGAGAAAASPTGPAGGATTAATTALPAGWALTKTTAGFNLTWHPKHPVPMGGAAVEFYAGGRLLGRPTASKDRSSFRIAIDIVTARNLTNLQVRAGGRRLDAVDNRPFGVTGKPQSLAATQLPANPVDPGTPGQYATTSGDYTLPDVRLPGLPAPVEMRGHVVAPTGLWGPRPLVLILHGNHVTCYKGTSETSGVWPCPSGMQSIPSYRGYEKTQQLLASQGYVTVSISANGINGQGDDGLPNDGGAQARSSLVRLHLSRWADWAGADRNNAPEIVRAAPTPDMYQTLLVGHSRGGEGVSRAALDSISPPPADRDGYRGSVRWQIRGLALIGPTFAGQNPVPDVPTMTILPGCDGDVSNLEGEQYADVTRGMSVGVALHSSVYVVGANHNFFNTEWTPGLSTAKSVDDTDINENPSHDPTCNSLSSMRLTPTQQQKIGATYVAAAAATFVAGNDQVRPLLDGSGVRVPALDPVTILSHAVGGNRTPFVVPDSSTVVTGAGSRLCEGSPDLYGNTDCGPISPHFASFVHLVPDTGRYAVAMGRNGSGISATIRPSSPVSLANSSHVALRMFMSTFPDNRFDVAITDSAGHRAKLGTASLATLPGSSQTVGYWAQEVRVPLSNAITAGLNLSQIASLDITARDGEAGYTWLIDAWGWNSGTPNPWSVTMPRVDLGETTVREGNSGTVTYQLPTTVSGSGQGGTLRVFVQDPITGKATSSVVTVTPGNTTISIPIRVTGNTTRDGDRKYIVAARPIKGVFVGDGFGQLTVQDDDV